MKVGDILMINKYSVKELLVFAEGKNIVYQTYVLYNKGDAVNPQSIFLRPDAVNRIIGLPAFIEGKQGSIGIKWVASYPYNINKGIPRASSVIILNDTETGIPLCCINGSLINLFRTACSAFLVLENLFFQKSINLGIVGTGALAESFLTCIKEFGTVPVQNIAVFDKNADRANKFVKTTGLRENAKVTNLETVICSCDVVLFSTTASVPYIVDQKLFSHNPFVIHLSLRDLGEDIILSSNNIVDDLDHVNRENTSVNLASKKVGNTNFINGDICQLLTQSIMLDQNKPIVFSPFGLGVLDIAIAKYIFERANEKNQGTIISNFF